MTLHQDNRAPNHSQALPFVSSNPKQFKAALLRRRFGRIRRKAHLLWFGHAIQRSERPRSLPVDREARQAHRIEARKHACRVPLSARLKEPYFQHELAVLNVLSIMQREAGGKPFAAYQDEVRRRAHVSLSTVYRTMKKAAANGHLQIEPMRRDVSRRSLPRIMRFIGSAYEAVMKASQINHRPPPHLLQSTAAGMTSRQYINEEVHIEQEYKERRIKALTAPKPAPKTLEQTEIALRQADGGDLTDYLLAKLAEIRERRAIE